MAAQSRSADDDDEEEGNNLATLQFLRLAPAAAQGSTAILQGLSAWACCRANEGGGAADGADHGGHGAVLPDS